MKSSTAAPSDTINLLTRKEAATLLRVSYSSLCRWSLLGTGPIYRKLNGGVFYELADLQQFVADRARISTGRVA